MNKTAQLGFTYINKLNGNEKFELMASFFNDSDYVSFLKKHDKVKNKAKLAADYVKNACWERYHAKAVNGMVQPSKVEYKTDRLKPNDVWMPDGSFGYSKSGSYVALGVKVPCTEVNKGFILKKYEDKTKDAWDTLKSVVLTAQVGHYSNEWCLPWLDYDPVFTSDQHVYFIHDESNSMVKIGISNDISSRIDAIRKQYRTGRLKLVAVIARGGIEIERTLHEKFHHINVREEGKGREWFKMTKELEGFIGEMNEYAFKSEFLKEKELI